MIQQLSVRLHGRPVGVLEQNALGQMVFTYDADAKQAISLNMPVREKPYDNNFCEAFFGGLLPESDTVRRTLGKRYGINHNNTFSLLKAIGYDCAGAISLHDINAPIQLQEFFELAGRIVPQQELDEHLKELPNKPLFTGFGDLRLSLAGVHDKGAICMLDGYSKILLPENGCPTTHILKPAVPGFEGIIENEFHCLKLAMLVGLPVPRISSTRTNDISYFIIQRYDRLIENNKVKRIHQEDFCQALGIVSAKKYQADGGPGIKDCFDLLNKSTQPAIDRNILMKAIIFNYFIGNMDAHGKNFSLLHLETGEIILAPFYDIICTLFYPNLSTKMAMSISKYYESESIFPRHWQKLCEEIQFSFPAFKQLFLEIGEGILKHTVLNKKLHNQKIMINDFNILSFIEKRVKECLKQFSLSNE